MSRKRNPKRDIAAKKRRRKRNRKWVSEEYLRRLLNLARSLQRSTYPDTPAWRELSPTAPPLPVYTIAFEQ